MSGGYFDYVQYRIVDISDSLVKLINENPYNYSQETIDKFKQASETAVLAAKMIQRVDWLLSSDDSEETFHERWKHDLGKQHDL